MHSNNVISWMDYLPEYTSWTGMMIYSLILYLISLILSYLLSPLLAPSIPEQYKK